MSAPFKQQASLDVWMRRQYGLSAAKMMSAISRVDLVKERRGFGRLLRPAKGSILASPVIAAYDPDPDYFFHWLRDSAVIIDALRLLIESEEIARPEGLAHFSDFLGFSLTLCGLDGRSFLAGAGDYRAKVEPHFAQFLRPEADLLAISGDDILGEPRFDPDGSIDILKWSRPQHDGPALRVLAVARFCQSVGPGPDIFKQAEELIIRDLGFTFARWRAPSFDIWEEELGRHYYTQLVQCEALREGGLWLESRGAIESATAYLDASQEIAAGLDDFWSAPQGFVRSRIAAAGSGPQKELDIATVLAVIHAGREAGAHSVCDSRLIATLGRLEALFADAYTINTTQPGADAPAMGRYDGDRYYSGGAYFFSTLGAAEFHFKAAQAVAKGFLHDASEWARIGLDSKHDGHHLFEALLRCGDLFMTTVAAYTSENGDLSEQFDQTTGVQTSAKNLAWSHAAFISAYASREKALRSAKGVSP
ncbi:Glucan 1,4-alpha-glucosidase [Methylocella silvestris BL2]|uniref:glucan 1,4-alpha-glucosidase n=1 Tax=Methylocella silvestris (strain DSM 15510 / CIP 108128 / LMG 27833 / NCIMB 13906 / BL2) TaxID=395965 RepID=B8EQV8_METSB|nr:glycoside hydrolase family 15 protein [Methylocella silvestris]ACK49379.1 Glucan 1,4-alpha-glucosidase [Methylocella silvestris BL2]